MNMSDPPIDLTLAAALVRQQFGACVPDVHEDAWDEEEVCRLTLEVLDSWGTTDVATATNGKLRVVRDSDYVYACQELSVLNLRGEQRESEQ